MLNEEDFRARAGRIRLVAMDVDGVLTDGSIVLTDAGEAKVFHVRDGLGITIARSAGLQFALVTGRSSPIVERRARELGIDIVEMACSGKAEAVRRIAADNGLSPDEIAFIGDDWNDLPAMGICGLSAAPADAPEGIRDRAHLVTSAHGGRGAVREFLETLFDARGGWEEVAERYARGLSAPTAEVRQ